MQKKGFGFFQYFKISTIVILCLLAISYIMYYLFSYKRIVEDTATEPIPSYQIQPVKPVETKEAEISAPLVFDEDISLFTEPELVLPEITEIEDENHLVPFEDVMGGDGSLDVGDESFEVVEPFGNDMLFFDGRVPDPPFMFDPLVTDAGERFLRPTFQAYDDDYFKDFFIQGQDSTLDYEDGFYYLTLFVNEEQMGSIEVKFESEKKFINSFELLEFLSEYITEEARNRIFADIPDYVSKEYLISKGVGCEINDVAFQIRLTFSIEDMPLRIITITGGVRNMVNSYALSGATELEPAFFSWVTNYNLFFNLNTYLASNYELFSTNISTSNFLNIGPINLDFYYSVTKAATEWDFNFSSYKMYHDFVDQNIRLSWGNISSYSLGNKYSSVGVSFEKNYSFGTGTPKTNQYFQTITVKEDSELLITNSEGKELYRRNLSPGNYRIKDFLLNTGINVITITLTPLSGKGMNPDGTDFGAQQWSFQMAYDSQLLAYGDTLYGGSISIGRDKVALGSVTSGNFALRMSSKYYFDYHLDDLVINYWQNVGLSDTLTLGYDISLASLPKDPVTGNNSYNSVFSTQFTNANIFGTSNLKLLTGISSNATVNDNPRFYAMFSHRFKMDKIPLISSLSLLLAYQNPSYKNSLTNSGYDASLSFGGAVGFLRYSLSSSINFETDYGLRNPEFTNNLSVSFSPSRSTSISASFSANKRKDNTRFDFSANLSATVSISQNSSSSISTNLQNSASLNIYSRFGKNKQHYLQTSINNILFKNPTNLNFGFAYSYSGSLLGINFRSQIYNGFNSLAHSLSLSMSSVFADGVFTIAKSVGDNYLLIKPTGYLKGSEIAVARSRDNSSKVVDSRLGSALYNDIGANTRNSIVVYATGKDSFADTHTFSYELTPYSRKAYVARITAHQSYTATGLILGNDGKPLELFSSPVYSIIENENGNKELVIDSNLYLFTDQDGRFILSNINAGHYFIDVKSPDNKWISVHFEVVEQSDDSISIQDFETISLENFSTDFDEIEYDIDDNIIDGQDHIYEYELLQGYAYAKTLKLERVMTSEDFWNSIFPPFEEEQDLNFEDFDISF